MLVVLFMLACSSPEGDGSSDGGTGDGGLSDGGSGDGGSGDGGSGDGGSGDGGSGDGGSSLDCSELPAAEGDTVRLTTDDVADLASILYDLTPGTTVLLADGTYEVDGDLQLRAEGVTLRGESGRRARVVFDADYRGGSILSVTASDVTVAHMTLRRAWYHGVHVTPEGDQSITGVRLYDIAVLDPGQQGIKVNQNGSAYTDDGEIACSWIELTSDGRSEIRDGCYTGGIDAHKTRGWWVHDNTVVGFWCPAGLSEHGIHFWRQNRDAVIERNTVVHCARGIGLGLADSSSGDDREHSDVDCPAAYIDDYTGTVRNNVVYASDPDLFASEYGMDGGISLASACDATVVHNTVWSSEAPFASIEYRFDGTTALIANNLLSHDLMDRGVTSATLSTNIEEVSPAWLVAALDGDLHLSPDAVGAIDTGTDVGVALDFDGDVRDAAPDIGADELVPPQ